MDFLKYLSIINYQLGCQRCQVSGDTTHFSWRNNNLSIYKPFQHQHIVEIRQSLKQVQEYHV